MPHQLIAGSDSNAYALFDPAALEPFQSSDASIEDWEAWLRRQAADGRMLECRIPLDGDTMHLAVFVDEPFDPPAPHQRLDLLDGAILRVPSGRLRLYGVEAIPSAPADDRDHDGGIAADLYTDRTKIPPGTYRVTAFRVEYHIPPARRDAELQAELEPGDVAYVRSIEKLAMPTGFALALFAVLAAGAFALSASSWIWRLIAGGIALVIAAIASLALWGLMTSPRAMRFRTVESEIEKRYPSAVVMLERLADDAVPAAFPPARFGGGNGGGE